MELKQGETYRARNGSKIGPLEPARSPGYDYYGSDGGTDRVFQKNGKHGGSYIKPNPDLDLISEWTDGPVRTVTRREVVEGVYGIVRVDTHRDQVVISIDPSAGHNPTSVELRAAAAVLLELAGALPDGE